MRDLVACEMCPQARTIGGSRGLKVHVSKMHQKFQLPNMSKSHLVLWKVDASPPARAVMVLGDILGLNFEYKSLNMIKLEHKSPEFLKLNPIGTIPVLQDGDFVLTDSHAIMKYLLSQYGGELNEQLYPTDVRTRAVIDQALFFNAAVYFIRVKNVALPTLLKGLSGPSEQNIQDINDAYSVVEAYLGDKPYIAWDRFTIADISLGITTVALLTIHKYDKEKYPRLAAWYDRIHEVPEFRIHSVLYNDLGVALAAFWAKNKLR